MISWFAVGYANGAWFALALKSDKNLCRFKTCADEYFWETGNLSCCVEFPLSDSQFEVLWSVCEMDPTDMIYMAIKIFSGRRSWCARNTVRDGVISGLFWKTVVCPGKDPAFSPIPVLSFPRRAVRRSPHHRVRPPRFPRVRGGFAH